MSLKYLELVAIAKKYAGHPEFIGINIENVNQPGSVDDTLLHITARIGAIEDVKILITHGAFVDAIGDLGNTPLHQAAMTNQLVTAEFLLKKGANPRLINEFEQTPLDVAEIEGHKNMVELIQKYLR